MRVVYSSRDFPDLNWETTSSSAANESQSCCWTSSSSLSSYAGDVCPKCENVVFMPKARKIIPNPRKMENTPRISDLDRNAPEFFPGKSKHFTRNLLAERAHSIIESRSDAVIGDARTTGLSWSEKKLSSIVKVGAEGDVESSALRDVLAKQHSADCDIKYVKIPISEKSSVTASDPGLWLPLMHKSVVEGGEKARVPDGQYIFVFWDIETTGLTLLDEIYQLGAYCPGMDNKFTGYLMPTRPVDDSAAEALDFWVFRSPIDGKCTLYRRTTGENLHASHRKDVLKNFILWLRRAAKSAGFLDPRGSIILVSHGDRIIDLPLLLKLLSKYPDLEDEFGRLICGFVDTQPIFNEYFKSLGRNCPKSLDIIGQVTMGKATTDVNGPANVAELLYRIVQFVKDADIVRYNDRDFACHRVECHSEGGTAFLNGRRFSLVVLGQVSAAQLNAEPKWASD
ncbi:unnamed protein product [Notodromas monacha]|uniref:Exuperantia RNAse H-like domain-containing protein n=1 Tax=Notodromas monacha TaxID=399045 RepID=A0A7R9GEN3_9CRUS|nr:unnamed protein product [Notodromas monacha]CAG0919810.1 unnamed protein product [Notodromas monacha]